MVNQTDCNGSFAKLHMIASSSWDALHNSVIVIRTACPERNLIVTYTCVKYGQICVGNVLNSTRIVLNILGQLDSLNLTSKSALLP